MDLRLDGDAGEGYSSASQWARRVTEAWAEKQLYCVACPSLTITSHRANTKVEDYHCPRCSRRLQLKAKADRIGKTVANSAFSSKMAAIKSNSAPDYAFLAYHRLSLRVTDLFVVPGHFLTESVVSIRNPLRPSAERAGWIGSNIHLDRIPEAGKIWLVVEGAVKRSTDVRQQFRRAAFIRDFQPAQRGWLTDVLRCVEDLAPYPGNDFFLSELYSYAAELGRGHPANKNIKPKIRQQVQLLRDRGLIRFEGKGRYSKL